LGDRGVGRSPYARIGTRSRTIADEVTKNGTPSWPRFASLQEIVARFDRLPGAHVEVELEGEEEGEEAVGADEAGDPDEVVAGEEGQGRRHRRPLRQQAAGEGKNDEGQGKPGGEGRELHRGHAHPARPRAHHRQPGVERWLGRRGGAALARH